MSRPFSRYFDGRPLEREYAILRRYYGGDPVTDLLFPSQWDMLLTQAVRFMELEAQGAVYK